MANQVEHFLEKWRETDGIAELLARLVRYQFVQLNPLRSLELRFPPHLIFYKYQDPVIGPEGVQVGEAQQLALGKMYTMHALAGAFGYLFEFPNARFLHGPGYFSINRRNQAEIIDAQVTIKSQYLTIFSSEKGVLCVGKVPPTYVERYGFKNGNAR